MNKSMQNTFSHAWGYRPRSSRVYFQTHLVFYNKTIPEGGVSVAANSRFLLRFHRRVSEGNNGPKNRILSPGDSITQLSISQQLSPRAVSEMCQYNIEILIKCAAGSTESYG